MYPRLKSVLAGETHTLALADDNALWVCGDGMVMQSIADETTIPESLESAQQVTSESADLSAPYVEPPVETEALMVERLVNWLDDVWQTGGLSDVMTEQGYLAFRQSIAESVAAE
jgi:hypothetical protein